MHFTIDQNGMLQDIDKLIYRLPLAFGNLIERRLMLWAAAGYIQRAIQIIFRHMADMRDRMNGHPGTDGAHITRPNPLILLLEVLHGLKGIYGSKNDNTQREQQQDAENPQLRPLVRNSKPLLILSFVI
jgi:hypothetical protein